MMKSDQEARVASSAIAKLSAAQFGNKIGAPEIGVEESEPYRGRKPNEINGD
jgi:hypothetical protein